MTVSSMSLTSPRVTSGPTTMTSASTSLAPCAEMVTRCQPGSRPWSRNVESMWPERSLRPWKVRPPAVTEMGTPIAGAVTNARQPRSRRNGERIPP